MEQLLQGDSTEGGDYIVQAPTTQEADSNFRHHLMPRALVSSEAVPLQNSVTADSSRAPEKKHASARPPSVGTTPHKITHAMDKMGHSSSTINPVDLQASVFGRPTSTLSSMTVPIRLDALSYLLNNALMGAFRMVPQMPFYGNQNAMPMCHSSTPVCSSQMGQLSQNGCAGHGCCPAHFTAHVCPTAQLCPNQPQVCPGNTCTDASKWPCSPIGIQNETTILCPPVVQRDPNATSWNTGGGWCTQSNENTNVIEANRWNGKPTETIVESQNSNFVQPKSSFSGGSDRHSSSPKRGFGNSPQRSFGSWKDNQRGSSWSGRQQRDFGKPMGRSNDNFNSGSWRGNSRDQNRDSTFGGRSSTYDFGNRKRNQDESPWSQDEGQGTKLGRWSGGRGRGGGRGSWQQRSDGSTAQSDIGNLGDRFKSSATTTSSFTKNDKSNEDWEADYKPEKPQQASATTPRWSLTVDKRPVYPNSVVATNSNTGLSSFAKKDNLSEDWETDYKEEQSSASTSKGPGALDQTPVDLKPRLTNCNTEDMEVAFEATKNATADEEDSKPTKNVNTAKEILKDDPAVTEEKCNTPEPDQDDCEKGVFEKFMETFLADEVPKHDVIGQATSAELEEGELDNTSENLDAEHTHLESTSAAPASAFHFCSLPIMCVKEACSREEAVTSEAVGTDNKSTVSETVDPQKEFPQEHTVSEAVDTQKEFSHKSAVSEVFATQKESPHTSAVSEAVNTQELPEKPAVSETVETQKEFAQSAVSEAVITQDKFAHKSAASWGVIRQEEFAHKPAVSEAVNPQEEFAHTSAVSEAVNPQEEFAHTSVVYEAVNTQKEFARRSAISEAVIRQDEFAHKSAVSETINTQKEFAHRSAVSGEVNTQKTRPDETAVSEAVDTQNTFSNESTI